MSAETDSAAPPRAAVFRQLGKVLLGLVLGLAIADVAIGSIDRERDLQDDDLHLADPVLRWTNRPGFENDKTRINAHGLRSPEIPADAPRDEVRILGVGDSRIFGAGRGGPAMDETWSRWLQDLCDAKLQGRWRVLNGGVMGYSALQAARRAMLLVPELRPDLVLVFVGSGQQVLLDPTAGKRWERVGGELLPADLASWWPEALWPAAVRLHQALRHSHLYTRWRAQLQGERQDPAFEKWVLTRAQGPPEVEERLTLTFAELELLGREARAQEVHVRAVVLPQAFQDSDGSWSRYLKRYAAAGAPGRSTPRAEPSRVLRERLEAAGLEVWSLEPEIDVIGSDRKRYTCDGTHWSPAGHAVVARGLFERLDQSGLADFLLASRRRSPRD